MFPGTLFNVFRGLHMKVPPCPLARGDLVKSPPGAKRWHRVRAVKRRFARMGRPPKRVFVGWEVVFKGLVTGTRHAMPMRTLVAFGYRVKAKEKA